MKTISVRDFLKGGYKGSSEPILVMNRSQPIGVWSPTGDIPHISSYTSTTTVPTITSEGTWVFTASLEDDPD